MFVVPKTLCGRQLVVISFTILLPFQLLAVPQSTTQEHYNDYDHHDYQQVFEQQEVSQQVMQSDIDVAISILDSIGITKYHLCESGLEEHTRNLLRCPALDNQRSLFDEEEDDDDDELHDEWFYLSHGFMALFCVCIAALAAGLTMGLLSLDPLLLLIKIRAGATEEERKQAASILPIVKQHHLLLVTLLLLNSLANEALPLFLEVLVSPVVAVILSVTLVLFFGEIIPSAVFTGPNKIALASKLTPVVRLVMFLLYPLAFPIAKLLDHLLHDDDHEGSDDTAFDRGELSALVRIQYEERMAAKQRRKQEKANLAAMVGESTRSTRSSRDGKSIHVGGLVFPPKKIRALATDVQELAAEVRATKRESALRQHQESRESTITTSSGIVSIPSTTDGRRSTLQRSSSIHMDEVTMIEGALQMKTKTAMDVFTPLHRVYSIPITLILNEQNVVDIYGSGYSRVPVFYPNSLASADGNKNRDWSGGPASVCGVLLTKQLMVINSEECRPVETLPLLVPMCVSPKENLVNLLNAFQTGTCGHMALVCARPHLASSALEERKPVPTRAGFMGVITMEDVIEELLQEEIYDETDRMEREATRIALWASRKWKNYVAKRKKQREQEAVAAGGGSGEPPSDSTPLLGDGAARNDSESGNSLAQDLWDKVLAAVFPENS